MIKTLAALIVAISAQPFVELPPQAPAVPAATATAPPPLPLTTQVAAVQTEAPPPVTTIAPPVTTIAPPVTTQTAAVQTEAPPPVTITTITAPITAPPRPLLPVNQFYGTFGQICDFAASPLKDVVCKAAGQAAIEQYPGFMKCERGYDCCMCDVVSCGSPYAGCNTFSAGDAGVAGVQNINVIGRAESLGGGAMNFIGIEAGAGAKVTGTNIKRINAAGQASLYNALVTAEPIMDFECSCSGERACENAIIEIKIAGPPPGYKCNPAYPYQAKELAAVKCSGRMSCLNTRFRIINEGCFDIEIQQIECTLPDSCTGTVFEIIPTNGRIDVNSCDFPNGAKIPIGVEQVCGMTQQQQWNPNYPGQYVPV